MLRIVEVCAIALAFTLNAAAVGPTDPSELQNFMDPLFRQQMEQLHIPGAVFVLVQDGRILLAKGYGYSNIEKKSPVLPDKTIFRAGSVSKVVTATLVMQQVQSGRLKLNEDINKYLKTFHMKTNHPAPITLRNLLTHTAGFDDRSIGSRARTKSEMKTLKEYLALNEPEKIHVPGKIFSYSNYGFSLAGYLAEQGAGIPFLQLSQQKLFEPLSMNRTSFQLEPSLIQDLATGYEFSNGYYVSVPPDYANTVPASGLVSCGTDMAKFMLSHLQDGQYQDAEMHKQQFTHHPKLPGVCYGFLERFTNGERAIWHDGDTGAFSSFLLLLPERDIGYFMSFNSRRGSIAREEITKKFFDHYFPIKKKEAKSLISVSTKQLSHLSGTYRYTRYSHTTFEKIGVLAGIIPEILGSVKNNQLHLLHHQLVPVEKDLFEWDDSSGYVFFRKDSNGDVTYMFFGSSLPKAYERIPWYGSALFQQILIVIVVASFISGFVIWTILQIRDERKSIAGMLAVVNCFLSSIFLIGLSLFLLHSARSISYGMPPTLKLLLWMPPLLILLAVMKMIFTGVVWKRSQWSVGRRIHYSFLVLTDLLFIGFLFYWRLAFPC
ncbi:beta-lactamase family protein [bacterium]|nr:beta-lactamase family protein [bacterium]